MTGPDRDRLASLFGALVSSADVASGFHPEKAIRTAIVAERLARAHGLDEAQQSDAFYLALVRFLGCTSFAPEAARFGGGDDISVGAVMAFVDPSEPLQLIGDVLKGLGRGAPPAKRIKGVVELVTTPSAPQHHAETECDVAAMLARRIGMPDPIVAAVGDLFERWDGKGHPNGKEGEEIFLLSRLIAAADVLELGYSRYGLDAVVDTARKRSGGRFDPAIVRTFCDHAPIVFDGLGAASAWDTFLDEEPPPHLTVTSALLARYAEAFARAVDLKSVWTATHSHRVGVLVADAGEAAGLDRSSVEQLRIAGWLHDLGRVAVPNLIWDKPGALNAAEWEQVRLHAYQTERLLARSPLLASVARIAGGIHERCDGSGYPKSLSAMHLDDATRLLAAADVYCALSEDRPHRPAYGRDGAVAILSDEAAQGRLDRSAVRALLDATGAGPASRVVTWPAGLSDREVEVLRLVSRGATNKDVARILGISPRTVQHHVAHVYTKIGVTSRAGAALFAAENNLTAPRSHAFRQ